MMSSMSLYVQTKGPGGVFVHLIWRMDKIWVISGRFRIPLRKPLEQGHEDFISWAVASSLLTAKEPRCSSIHKTVDPLLQIQGLVSGIHDVSCLKILLYNQVINQGFRPSSNASIRERQSWQHDRTTVPNTSLSFPQVFGSKKHTFNTLAPTNTMNGLLKCEGSRWLVISKCRVQTSTTSWSSQWTHQKIIETLISKTYQIRYGGL